jgi:predicted transposase/invertase (TIGR01784 family)
MLETEEHFPFNDLMEIHALNLARVPVEGEGKLLDWLRFLKAETEEEFKMLAEKNPMIREAYCKLQAMSQDEANRMIYEARLKAQRDEYSRVQGALEKGWAEGRQEGWTAGQQEGWTAGRTAGRTEGWTTGRKEVARTLKALGDPVEKIARATGLSPDEIAAL